MEEFRCSGGTVLTSWGVSQAPCMSEVGWCWRQSGLVLGWGTQPSARIPGGSRCRAPGHCFPTIFSSAELCWRLHRDPTAHWRSLVYTPPRHVSYEAFSGMV